MFIIDRLEDDWAVIEFDRTTFNLPRALLPTGAREGDVLNIHVSFDQESTLNREKIVKRLADELFED